MEGLWAPLSEGVAVSGYGSLLMLRRRAACLLLVLPELRRRWLRRSSRPRREASVTEAARSHVCQPRAIPFTGRKGGSDDTSTLWGVNQTELGMEHQVVVVGQPIF